MIIMWQHAYYRNESLPNGDDENAEENVSPLVVGVGLPLPPLLLLPRPDVGAVAVRAAMDSADDDDDGGTAAAASDNDGFAVVLDAPTPLLLLLLPLKRRLLLLPDAALRSARLSESLGVHVPLLSDVAGVASGDAAADDDDDDAGANTELKTLCVVNVAASLTMLLPTSALADDGNSGDDTTGAPPAMDAADAARATAATDADTDGVAAAAASCFAAAVEKLSTWSEGEGDDDPDVTAGCC
jgi:hypothetical protein